MNTTEQLLEFYRPEFEAGMVELLCSETTTKLLKAMGQDAPTPEEVAEKGMLNMYTNPATRSAWAGYVMALQQQWRNGNVPPPDMLRLNWLEQRHTLHDSVEFLYVVDGYECVLLNFDNPKLRVRGATLRDAIDLAMKEHP